MAECEAQQKRRRMPRGLAKPEKAHEVDKERDVDERDKQDTPTNPPSTPTAIPSTPSNRPGKRKITPLHPTSTPGDPANTLVDAVSSPTQPDAPFTPSNRTIIAPRPANTISNFNNPPQTRGRTDLDDDFLYDLRARRRFPWPEIVASAKEQRGLDLSISEVQQRVSSAVDRYRRKRPKPQSDPLPRFTNGARPANTSPTPVDSNKNDEFLLDLMDRLNLTPSQIVARAKAERGIALGLGDLTARILRARNRRRVGQPKPQPDALPRPRDGASGAGPSNPVVIDSNDGDGPARPSHTPTPQARRPPTQPSTQSPRPAPFIAPRMPPPSAPASAWTRDSGSHPIAPSPASSRAPPMAPPPAPAPPSSRGFGLYPMNPPPPPPPREPGQHPMNPPPSPASAPPRGPGPHSFNVSPFPAALLRPRDPGPHPHPVNVPQAPPAPIRDPGPHPMNLPPAQNAPPIPTITALIQELGISLLQGDDWLVRTHEGQGLTFAQIHDSLPADRQGPLGGYGQWRRYQGMFQDIRDLRLMRLRETERLDWDEIARRVEAESGVPTRAEDVAHRYQRLRGIGGSGQGQ